MPYTVLISGGNRGIGKGLVAAYLLRPDHVVIATARDPAHETAQSLKSLPVGKGTSLIVVPYSATSDTSASEAVELLKTKHDIKSLDLVIANAAIANYYGYAHETPLEQVREHFNVNVVGVLSLFQAVYPLLKAANTPKFVAIGSTAGSIGMMDNIPLHSSAYGTSKAALNFLVRKIHFEYPEFIAFPINPGWIKTDMGNAGARFHGLEEAPTELKESIDGLTKQIDEATREKSGGLFGDYAGETPSW